MEFKEILRFEELMIKTFNDSYIGSNVSAKEMQVFFPNLIIDNFLTLSEEELKTYLKDVYMEVRDLPIDRLINLEVYKINNIFLEIEKCLEKNFFNKNQIYFINNFLNNLINNMVKEFDKFYLEDLYDHPITKKKISSNISLFIESDIFPCLNVETKIKLLSLNNKLELRVNCDYNDPYEQDIILEIFDIKRTGLSNYLLDACESINKNLFMGKNRLASVLSELSTDELILKNTNDFKKYIEFKAFQYIEQYNDKYTNFNVCKAVDFFSILNKLEVHLERKRIKLSYFDDLKEKYNFCYKDNKFKDFLLYTNKELVREYNFFINNTIYVTQYDYIEKMIFNMNTIEVENEIGIKDLYVSASKSILLVSYNVTEKMKLEKTDKLLAKLLKKILIEISESMDYDYNKDYLKEIIFPAIREQQLLIKLNNIDKEEKSVKNKKKI